MAIEDNTADSSRLEELGSSNYEIVDGQPNIKGWSVKDSAGNLIGAVNELLFNPASRNVRYIVLDLASNDFDFDERMVLIPIGVAELHSNDSHVVIPLVTASQINALPTYNKGTEITTEKEEAVRSIFLTSNDANTSRNVDFYDHEHFNTDKFYGTHSGPGFNEGNDLLSEYDELPPTTESITMTDNVPPLNKEWEEPEGSITDINYRRLDNDDDVAVPKSDL